MHIAILGAGGMVGSKLANRISQGALGEASMTLIDQLAPAEIPGARSLSLDLTAQGAAQAVADLGADVVVHLAAVPSGGAEADFDLGYAINLDFACALAEALRHATGQTRLVFSSTCAVYGPPFPTPVPEDFRPCPASSYGTHKAMAELLFADYTRKGFLRATSLRLPTVSIRPGAPNAAASGFLSGILREPLHGLEATLPVGEDIAAWIASPNVTVEGLLQIIRVDWERIADPNPINLRGFRVSVAEMLDGLERAAGPEARALVKFRPDAEITRLVTSWPVSLITNRAERLGFPGNTGIDQVIEEYRSEYLV